MLNEKIRIQGFRWQSEKPFPRNLQSEIFNVKPEIRWRFCFRAAAQNLPALCTSILSARVDSGTERTRGESWYQTRVQAGRPAFPVAFENCGWDRLLCASAGI